MPAKNSNVNIYKFRVIVDTEEDVFRDIEIETNSSFEEFHKAILDSFDFEEGEMASFYMSNESWEKGLEISLMDVGGAAPSMANTKLEDMLSKPSDKVLYVYDFLRMWIFYVELVEVKKDKPSTIYPRVALVYGEAPAQDSKEMDLFGSEFSEEEFNEVHGNASGGEDDEDEDDMFGESGEYFDESDFDGSYSNGDDY
ncbi:MAG: IS1096 element passenger TnpR family protein [Flavobacteriales bacterium]